jgi:hypothetical protein
MVLKQASKRRLTKNNIADIKQKPIPAIMSQNPKDSLNEKDSENILVTVYILVS